MIPPKDITLAAAAYPLERLTNRSALREKLARWVADAGNADILVFPEYAAVEAAALDGFTGSVDEWCIRSAECADWFRDTMRDLAMERRCHILSGSGPAWNEGRLVNRAWLISPDGRMGPVDKQMLTPWERENTDLVAGKTLSSFQTTLGHVGVLICYDSEFPLLARAIDCDVLLVPSCTDAHAGSHRVNNACRARALEGQFIAVHSPLLGTIPDSELVDENHGRAGIYAPCDNGWPADGILAQREMDSPGWTITTIPSGMIGDTRKAAAVDIPGHWSETENWTNPVPLRL